MAFEAVGGTADVTSTAMVGKSMAMHDHLLSLPDTGGQIAATALTGYVAGAAALSASKVARSNRLQEKRLQQALAELDQLSTLRGRSDEVEALRYYVQQELRTVRFMKWIPGRSSAVSSSLIVIGQFLSKLSPAGLYLTAVNGAAHIGDAARRMGKTRAQLRAIRVTSPAAAAQREHLRKELALLRKSLASWILFTGGAIALGTFSALAIAGVAVLTQQVLAIAGALALGIGIVGAFVYNGPLYGKAFSPGLPESLAKQIERELDGARRACHTGSASRPVSALASAADIEQRLQQAASKRTLAKQYRAKTFERMHWFDRGSYRFAIGFHSVATLASVGLAQEKLAKLKRQIKEWSSGHFNNGMPARLDLLRALQALATAGRYPAPCVADADADADAFDTLVNLLHGDLHGGRYIAGSDQIADGVGKLLARRLLTPQMQWRWPDWPPPHGRWLPHRSAALGIRDRYVDLCGAAQAVPGSDFLDDLSFLANCPPCCSGGYQAKSVIEVLKQRYDAGSEPRRQQIFHLLTEVTDQYLVYALSNQSQQELARYSQHLAAFQRLEKAAT